MNPAFQTYLQLSNSNFTLSHNPARICSPLSSSNNSGSTRILKCVAEPPVRQKVIRKVTGPALGFKTAVETPDPITLSVQGKLPDYLHGTKYYRNGPGKFDEEHADGSIWKAHHWLDGMAMINSFSFNSNNNTVTFRSRFLGEGSSRAIKSVSQKDFNQIVAWQPEPNGVLDRLKRFTLATNDPVTGKAPINTSVTIERIPGREGLTARTDLNIGIGFDSETLEETDMFTAADYDRRLDPFVSCSHGLRDEDTGEYFNFVFRHKPWKVWYQPYSIDKHGKVTLLGRFIDNPYFLHSFSLTDNYMIISLWPCHVNLPKLFFTKNYVDALGLRDDAHVRFVVISRKSKKVVANYYHDAPIFAFHSINAFEEDDSIQLDVCAYEDLKVFQDLHIDQLVTARTVEKAIPTRVILPNLSEVVKNGLEGHPTVEMRPLSDQHLEMPTIAPKSSRKHYRYVYGMSHTEGELILQNVGKLDILTGKMKKWKLPGMFMGEPIFVPRPNGKREDDGCLIVQALDGDKGKSVLLIVDAQTMTEICRAVVPVPLPHGFHGIHVSENNNARC